MKQKLALLTLLLVTGIAQLAAQDRYFTKTGTISFHSKTDLENIDATNKLVTAALDTKTGAIQFNVPMKAFEFKRALMQEHFNENYVESEKFPNGTFKGRLANNASIKYGTPGTYDVTVEGDLTIHGVTKKVNAPGKVVISQGAIDATAAFEILLADYNITIPALVADKISKKVNINVVTKLEPLKN
ncbi:MAG: YceI family protein [Flavitalea sp.]